MSFAETVESSYQPDEAFIEMRDGVLDENKNILLGLIVNKLDQINAEVLQWFDHEQDRLADVFEHFDDIATQVPDDEQAFEKMRCYLKDDYNFSPEQCEKTLDMYMLVAHGAALFELVAYSVYKPEMKRDFTMRRAMNEAKELLSGVIREFGGVGEAQAEQIVSRFCTDVEQQTRGYMKEHNIATTQGVAR